MENGDLQLLLLRHGLVTQARLRDAVSATRGTAMSWLERLVLLDVLDEEAVCQCVAGAYHLRRCGLDVLAAVPAAIVALLPSEVALEHRAIPIAVDRDGDVRLAMVDPGDAVGLREIAFFTGRRPMREVALASDVAVALERHYGAVTALLPRLRAGRAASPRSRSLLDPPPAAAV